jgi:hypothetical protein
MPVLVPMALAYAECNTGRITKGFVTVVGISNPLAIEKTQSTTNLVSEEACWEYEAVKIPYVECGDNGPERKLLEVLVKKGSLKDDDFKKLEASADLAAIGCRKGAIEIVFPETYQIKRGAKIPQGKLIFREVQVNGSEPKRDRQGKLLWGSRRRVWNIPHCDLQQGSKPDVSHYQTGQWYGRAVLKDGSTLFIYGKDQETVQNNVKSALENVSDEFVPSGDTGVIFETYGITKGVKLAEYLVYPYRFEYYSGNNKAFDWYEDYPDE